jgi:hypothetical protein
MEANNFVLVEQFCSNVEIDLSFINSLNDHGLIEIMVIENKDYISNEHLRNVERAIRLHDELNINIEGIDVICNLLEQIHDLQQELKRTKNKLKLFDLE